MYVCLSVTLLLVFLAGRNIILAGWEIILAGGKIILAGGKIISVGGKIIFAGLVTTRQSHPVRARKAREFLNNGMLRVYSPGLVT